MRKLTALMGSAGEIGGRRYSEVGGARIAIREGKLNLGEVEQGQVVSLGR